jgi:methionyl-tRNA synthetase
MEDVDYSGAMSVVRELCNRANLYVEESAPWNLAKAAQEEIDEKLPTSKDSDVSLLNTESGKKLAFVIYNALESIRIMAVLYAPVMPESSAEVWRRLGLDDVNAIGKSAYDLDDACKWGQLKAGTSIQVGNPLFPRLKEEDLS